MAFDIGELRGTISLNDTFSGPVEKVADTLGLAGQSFGAVAGLAGIAASAIAGATAAVVMLGQRGAAVQDVRGAFDNLTSAAGSTSEVMLGALRSGTLGTISDFDLMSKANAVLGSGMVTTADEMGTLAAGAKMLADRTGGDTAEAFDTLTGAMASGRVATLKQMGVFVDTKGAIQEYANALGISVDKLTAEQRAEAISTATLAALKAQLAAAGPATADFGDQIDRGKVAIQNFTDNLAVAVATSPVVAAGLDGIAKGVSAAFGGSQQSMVETLMGFVNDFAIGLTYVAQVAVTVAGGFVQAWYLMKTVVLGVITAVSTFATGLVTIVTGLAEMAASVPGASAVVGDLAAGARALQADMAAVTLSLAAETAEAARGAAGHSELQGKLDAVGGAIINVREAMEAARGSAAGMTEANAAVVPPLAQIGATATLTAAQIKAMEEQTALSEGLMVESWTNAANLQAELQNQIALLQTSGIQNRLLELDIARQAEIAGIQNLAFESQAQYEVLAAQITEKYRIMAAAAQGYHDSVVAQARAAGFSTREELERTADNAVDTYNRMKASALFTAEEIRKAWEAAEQAKRNATGETATFTIGSVGAMLTATAGALQAFGVSYKAAALAGAILSGISAIQKAWASAPFPANIPAVTIVTAGTLANIAKIRSSPPGFAQGTPSTAFVDFGRVSTIDVHGPEAIVNRPQAEGVASLVEDALKAQDLRVVAELKGMREDMAADRSRLPLLVRDAHLMALA